MEGTTRAQNDQLARLVSGSITVPPMPFQYSSKAKRFRARKVRACLSTYSPATLAMKIHSTHTLCSIPRFDSIRAIAANLSVVLKVTWAIFVIVWIIGAFTSKRTVRRQSWASRFGIVAIAILEYLLLFWAARYFGFANRRFLP